MINPNGSNPNLRNMGGSQLSHSNVSQLGGQQMQAPMPQYGLPQLPFMPFGSGPPSIAGSDYNHMMNMPPQMVYQNTGSVYGMVPPGMAQRSTMMTGMNMFSSGASLSGSMSGPLPPSMPQQRPMSTFSMATSVNPFAGPSLNPNPTNDDLFNALRNYLSTQDLMTVTKK